MEVRFTIVSSPYKYSNKQETNVIEQTEASYGQLVIKTPGDKPAIFSDITQTKRGAITFTIADAMIDEIDEVGNYSFQIRLLDENKESRATIPEVVNGIEIREPIAAEDVSTSNAVGVATVGYALTTAATPEDAFDSQGNYNKTTWAAGDRITDAKLNKMEAGIDGVNKKVASVGNPTDEQVKNAINEAIANGDIIAGGLTSTAQTLLISILRNAVFTSNQSENITLLQSELAKGNSGESGGGSETTRYTITNTLNNATTSNNIALVDANSRYTATIRENDGYTLDTITVTMGGTDITSSVVSGTTITIASVTGNVVITVTTTQSSGGSTQELPTDGLLGYFDLRNVTQNSGSGGSYVINATQGSGILFSWYAMAETGDYGTTIKQSSYSNTTSTTSYDLGSEFTAIFKGHGGIFVDNNYFGNSNTYFAQINAYYKNTSGSPVKTNTGSAKAGKNTNTYNTLIMRVLNNTLDIYINGSLDTTLTGSNYSDFSSWVGQLTPQLIYNEGYATAFAVYNKALSETEIVDLEDYLRTLEVK